MVSEPIKVNPAAQPVTLLPVNFVSDAMNQNIGIQLTWNALPVMLDTSGTKISTSVTAALLQDKSSETNAFAPEEEPGLVSNASAQLEPTDLTVFHAHPPGSGTLLQANVFAHKTEFGTDKTAFALQVFSAQAAFHAHHQDSGMPPPANVFAPRTEFGTDKTAFVPQDSTDTTANHAHSQDNGWTTDVTVKLHSFGTELTVSAQLEPTDLNVPHAHCQESGTPTATNASAKPQPPTGTETTVSALTTPTDLNASHAQPQEDGTTAQTNVSAQLQWLSGTAFNVFAQLTPTDLNASHAQPQELGTSVQINVFAQLQKQFGTETHVSAQSTPSDKTASAAHLKNIGMKRPKPVFAQPVKSGTDNTAFAHHQQLSGTVPNAFAQPTLTDQTAFNAQPQDSGTVTIVSVLKRESGTVKTVSVPQDFSDPTAFNAHLRNIGTKEPKLVFAHLHSSGTVNTVSAQLDILWSTVNAADALLVSNGRTTNASTVTANIKLQSGGKIPTQAQAQLEDQLLTEDHQPTLTPSLPTFAQPVQSGMMLHNNASTAHSPTSPLIETQALANTNAIAEVLSSLLPTLMVLKLVNDFDLFDLLFHILFFSYITWTYFIKSQ